jgi:outer membrane protein TolC
MFQRFTLALLLSAAPTFVFAQSSEPVVSAPAPPAEVSLSLSEAVSTSLERSFRVQRSARNEDISERRVEVTRAQNRLRLDAGVGASQNQSYYDFQGNAFNFNRAEPQFYTDVNVSASIPIDISGVTRRQIKQARYSLESSKLDRRQATLDVSTDVRAAYTSALRSREVLRADEAFLARIESVLARARERQPAVVSFLEIERDNAIQTLASNRTTADLSLQSLRLLIHVPRTTRLVLTSGLPTPPAKVPDLETLLAVASDNRIDLRQAGIRLDQARLAEVQASDSRRPSLRATAYGSQRLNGETPLFNGDTGRTRSGGVVITGSLPIFVVDGGQLKNQRRIAQIQADQARADREEATERAENEISQVLISLNNTQQRLRNLPDVEQALAALEAVEQLMLSAKPDDASGYVAQLTNARQNWRQAVVSRNDAIAEFFSSYYRLQRAVGTEQIQEF